MRPRQLSLTLDGDANDHPVPTVYLACRLTGITDEQRKLLDSWCTHIEQAVTDVGRQRQSVGHRRAHPVRLVRPMGRHPQHT